MNYLGKYANKGVAKFQEGGAMPPEGAPAPGGAPAQGGGNPLEAMVAEYAQSRDPQLAVQIADAVVEMAMSQGGGGAPAPAMSKGGRMDAKKAPMFKAGGKL